MTSQGSAHGRFVRAIERRNLVAAETAARELGHLAPGDALKLVLLYASIGSSKFEPAAVRWVARFALERACSLGTLQLAAASFASLRGPDGESATRALVELARRPDR